MRNLPKHRWRKAALSGIRSPPNICTLVWNESVMYSLVYFYLYVMPFLAHPAWQIQNIQITDSQFISVHVFSWNKTDNPEPWNKLDPTYQYKVIQHTIHTYSLLGNWDDVLTVIWFKCLFFPSLWPSPQTIKTWRRMDPSFESHTGLLLQTRLKEMRGKREDPGSDSLPLPPLMSSLQVEGEMDPRSGSVTLQCLSACVMFAERLVPGMSGRMDTYDYWRSQICSISTYTYEVEMRHIYAHDPLISKLSGSISLTYLVAFYSLTLLKAPDWWHCMFFRLKG